MNRPGRFVQSPHPAPTIDMHLIAFRGRPVNNLLRPGRRRRVNGINPGHESAERPRHTPKACSHCRTSALSIAAISSFENSQAPRDPWKLLHATTILRAWPLLRANFKADLFRLSLMSTHLPGHVAAPTIALIPNESTLATWCQRFLERT